MKVIISKYNAIYYLDKIINRKIDPEVKDYLLEDLILGNAKYLQDYVIAQCYYLIEFLNDPERFIRKHGKEWKDTKTYYKESSPAYHIHDDCGWLNAGFENIKIPDKLKNFPEAIKIIRSAPKQILERNKFNQICQNLCNQLNFTLNLNPPVLVEDFELVILGNGEKYKMENDINETIKNIEELHKQAKKYLEVKPYIKSFRKNNYKIPTFDQFLMDYSLNHKSNNANYIYNTTFNDLIYFKKSILIPIEKRIKFYILSKINKECKFDKTILEILGFKPCRNCFKPYSGFHIIEERAKELIEY